MIVLTMAGASRRFAEAGFGLPKYMLPLDDTTVFDHAVGGFKSFFDEAPFLFVARDIQGTGKFIEERCAALGLRDFRTVLLDELTAGQAETAVQGLARSGHPRSGTASIFNIDTFRPGFAYPVAAWFQSSDGFLEVFEGGGTNWSYVRPCADEADEPLVAETAEKRPISDLCCTGLYHFRRWGDLHDALTEERQSPTAGELYVAPLFNRLIKWGRRIHYEQIASNQVLFCGTPAEYGALQKQGA
jgi:hypothetical protein